MVGGVRASSLPGEETREDIRKGLARGAVEVGRRVYRLNR